MKKIALVLVALFIDGIQAAVSAGIFIISAFPGTVFGGAAGCLAGKALAGDIGCAVGGFLLGILGSFANIIDVATVPLGVVAGFAISISLSFTLGAGLITLLIFTGMFYPKYLLPGGVAEIIPGFDLIPGWTAMTIMCVLRKSREEGGVVGVTAAIATGGGVVGAIQSATPQRSMDGIRSPETQINAA